MKRACGLSRLLSRNPDAEQAAKLTVALNVERFRDVLAAKHDAILTLGIRLVIPVGDSITIPLSVQYASHADLLTDQDLVTGHVGLAWDFSGLGKKTKK